MDALSREEMEKIVRAMVEETVREVVVSAVEDFVRKNEERAREFSVIERVVRVEEELRALREIESARFEALQREQMALREEINARFEALQREMDTRFEMVDRRFDSMEKRLNFIQWFIGIGFSAVVALVSLLRFIH